MMEKLSWILAWVARRTAILLALCIALACALPAGSALAETPKTEDELIQDAIEVLTNHWRDNVYGDGRYYKEDATGYLGIRFTRVIYLKENLPLDKPHVEEAFGGVKAFVGFVLVSDYLNTEPYYEVVDLENYVALLKDGSYEVRMRNPVNWYRTRTFTIDFSDIIESVSDRGAEFNADYHLLRE